jgi:DNA-binding LacI/PurR family transcriptional regulator
MGRPRRPRQSDVAALAGVSPALVSLVINGRVDGNVRISGETRERVWDAVRRLGYAPNPVARSLAGGRNRLLGVFTYESVFPLHQDTFYYPFLVGIEEEAEAQDYDLLLFTRTNGADGRRSIYKDGVNHLQLADGAVVLGGNENREELSRLLRDGFPFVFVGRREVAGGEVSYVAAGYAEATVEVVAHLVEFGHRRISYFRLPHGHEATRDREAGYRLAHQRLGLPLDERSVQYINPDGITPELVQSQLAGGVTAFITGQPSLAARLLQVAQSLGKGAPQDFSLVTQGDSPGYDDFLPGVTTFSIPRREMGAGAVRLLVERLSHPDDPIPRRVSLPCTFVPGRTIGPPPHTARPESS